MTDRVFVDTNVLVYSRDASGPSKQKQAMGWMTFLWSERAGQLSFQVLSEFYVTVTCKLRPGMDPQTAREDLRCLLAWRPIPVDAQVVRGAWRIQDLYKLSWWDSLIVSAAQVSDCRYLLTEHLREDLKMGEVKVIHPFHTLPESL